MIHHSLPGAKGFEILQESFYQNSTCQRNKALSDKKLLMSMKRASGSSSSTSLHNNNNNNNNNNSHPNSNSNMRGDREREREGTRGKTEEEEQNNYHEENPPPPPLPERSTSLLRAKNLELTSGTTTRYKQSMRESMTMNPKRISIATSTFWAGDPDLGHFVSGWEVGRDETNSVWNTTERGDCEKHFIWGDAPAIKKGILLHQSVKLWSRWKERYCILTRDYMHIFQRSTSITNHVRLSDMGLFIGKLRLADIQNINWETRKSGPVICLEMADTKKDGRYLRVRSCPDSYESLNSWYTLLQECVYLSKERRRALRDLFIPSSTTSSSHHNNNNNNNNMIPSTLQSHRSTMNKTKDQNSISASRLPLRNNCTSNSHSTSEGSPNSSSNASNNSSSSSSNSHSSSHDDSENHPRRGVKEDINKKRNGLASHNNNYSILRNHDEEEEDEDDDDVNNDHDEDDDYYDDDGPFLHIPTMNKSHTRSSIAIDTTGSHRNVGHNINGLPTMTLNDFVRNPWKNSHLGSISNGNKAGLGIGGGGTCSKKTSTLSMSGYSMPRDFLNAPSSSSSSHRISNSNNNHASQHNLQSHKKSSRPESWDQSIYKTPMSSSSAANSNNPGTFSRTRDPNISFRKMS